MLYLLQPRAMDTECSFFGPGRLGTLPLIIAAALPLPPKQASEYDNAKKRRWEKVKLLTLSATWCDERHEALRKAGEADGAKKRRPTAATPPEPTLQQVQAACKEAIRRGEWRVTIGTRKAILEARSEARRREGTREEWLRNNMGLLMYPDQPAMDLIGTVMPSSKNDPDEASGGIISPMS